MLEYKLSEVPEALQPYYAKQEDGSFTLQVTGVVSETEIAALKGKNKELRDNNINLLKTNESLSSFEQVFGTGNVKPEIIHSKIEELATKRANTLVIEMKSKYDERVKELESGLNKKGSKLTELMLGDAVQRAGVRHGVVGTAYDDVLRRAQSDFEVTDDGIKFKHERLDAEGKPYSVDSWMSEQAKLAPHLFAQSQGTGAARPNKSSVSLIRPTNAAGLIANGLNQTAGNNAKRIN